MNSAKKEVIYLLSLSFLLIIALSSTDGPNLLSFTANRKGICLVYREGETPRRSLVHQSLRRFRLAFGSEKHVLFPSNTGATEAHFEVQRRKEPLKMIAFMLKASKWRDGQAVIVCSGLKLRARHQ